MKNHQSRLTDKSVESDTGYLREDTHEQNNNWEWSDAFTEFISSQLSGLSLKICTGLRPICDVNVDIEDLRAISANTDTQYTVTSLQADAETSQRLEEIHNSLSETAPEGTVYGRVLGDADKSDNQSTLYDGYACTGDAFDLPFADNTFDTVVSDPPWLDMSASNRQSLFDEAARVTAPTGVIIYNAPWLPSHEHTRRYDLRARQQLDFWGGPSFVCWYRQMAATTNELFETHDYSSLTRYADQDSFWSEDFHPNAISKQHGTDPHMVSPSHDDCSCPQCNCTQLTHICDPELQSTTGEFGLYECHNCRFRTTRDEAMSK